MIINLQVQSVDSETILRALDHVCLVEGIAGENDRTKLENLLAKHDFYITHKFGYFITPVGELDEETKEALGYYIPDARKVVIEDLSELIVKLVGTQTTN